jgi:hypothetical protein
MEKGLTFEFTDAVQTQTMDVMRLRPSISSSTDRSCFATEALRIEETG